MDAQLFKDQWMSKNLGASFNGPELAASIKGIPKQDGTIGPNIQMNVPGYAADQRIGTVGIFDPEPNNPAAAEHGFDP